MNRRTFLAGVAAGPAAVLVPNCKRGPTNPKPPPATVAGATQVGMRYPPIYIGSVQPGFDLRGEDPDYVLAGYIEPMERLARTHPSLVRRS